MEWNFSHKILIAEFFRRIINFSFLRNSSQFYAIIMALNGPLLHFSVRTEVIYPDALYPYLNYYRR